MIDGFHDRRVTAPSPLLPDWSTRMGDAPRTEPLRLLTRGGTRLGQWDADRGCWRSTIDRSVKLAPVAWRRMPVRAD